MKEGEVGKRINRRNKLSYVCAPTPKEEYKLHRLKTGSNKSIFLIFEFVHQFIYKVITQFSKLSTNA